MLPSGDCWGMFLIPEVKVDGFPNRAVMRRQLVAFVHFMKECRTFMKSNILRAVIRDEEKKANKEVV